VIVLLGIGLLAGLVTAISPCVLPVLPVLLAGGASGRKPLRIIAGLVTSFTVFTLFASWLLDKLGLPQDFLRNLAIALLFLVAATLIVPQFARWLERPFARLTRFRAGGGGFLLGASLGLVFVPCAGPVLAAITVVAANHHVGWKAILLTLAYAIGAAIPMLAIAYGGRGLAGRLRAHAQGLRLTSGILIGLVALAIAFNQDTRFQTALPGYTSALQKHVEDTSTARHHLSSLTSSSIAKPIVVQKQTAAPDLPDYGVAPALAKTGHWFNSAPLTLKKLRGKVVLVDFWTYSCINCLRTIPHLESWYRTYKTDGLVVLGVHTPEFAFEHVTSNVGAAVKRLGITYPVVQDNDYGTWDAYANEYWPAEYLIDRDGHIRHTHFGESSYGETQSLIRELLGDKGGPMAKSLPDLTPTGLTTPESYLGFERLDQTRFVGSTVHPNEEASYAFPPSLGQNDIAYAGEWTVEKQRIVAGLGAKLRLHFVAQHVYLVLGGHGKVNVLVDGKPTATVPVNAYRLYTLHNAPATQDATLELRFTPGVQAYAFTFG
jgi:cytochrome c biogenesis protein CcdA/thiol-disulfide isomerase/thioredoxin